MFFKKSNEENQRLMYKYMTSRQRREQKARKWKRRKQFAASIAIIIALLFAASLYPRLLSVVRRTDRRRISSENTQGSESIVYSDPESIPDYSGEDYIVLNDGKPCFNAWDLENITGEHYNELDILGRCGTAYAMLDRTMMPKGEREDIGEIKPSGWVQKKYEGIVDSNPPYLYNRSHLIAYALTGQNANERNLITGTRYMNAVTMLPWEEKVMRYLDDSDNHVLYRITPHFRGAELLSRGVEMEAWSVEDKGAALCYHVFVYNVQPGIVLDYSTGGSRVEE